MKVFGFSKSPLLLIHGGVLLRSKEESPETAERNLELKNIAQRAGELLRADRNAIDVACAAVEDLENFPLFNAGYGSELQRDGVARLSASLMDGTEERFSAVALVTDLRHPIHLARALQSERDRVLGPLGGKNLVERLGLPQEDPVSPEKRARWEERSTGAAEGKHGTVGCVVLDSAGRLAAATSTGGRGFETVERMSDVNTVAGNYASRFAAISCSGVGEEIVDGGIAVRIEERVRSGKSLLATAESVLDECAHRSRTLGWIALSAQGEWSACATNTTILGALFSLEENVAKIFDKSVQ